MFDGLTALENLRLDSNDLTGLPDGVFDGLTALTWLSLKENSLTELPDGVFDGLTALVGLGLSDNELAELPDGIPRPRAVAGRLAALALDPDQRPGPEVADRRQLSELGVAAAFEFVDVVGTGHVRTSLSILYKVLIVKNGRRYRYPRTLPTNLTCAHPLPRDLTYFTGFGIFTKR